MDTEAGKLYIVATPIGNLSDMSLRAVETLRSVDLIAAEDTRNTIHLLTHFDIRTPMESYHEFNKYDKADDLVNRMLSGKNVAIVTDAGTPCISDPGEVLVAKCAEAGITITGIPGPSAAINALTLSGLSTRRFTFEGFLPAKKQKKERAAALERLKKETVTIIVYEAPHHLTETLKDLSEALGAGRRVALCREMTKIHEEVIRTTLSEAVETVPRGEYVLVIEGKDEKEAAAERTAEFSELSIEEHMQRYLEKGVEKKEAMKLVAADRGVTKRDIYKYLTEKE